METTIDKTLISSNLEKAKLFVSTAEALQRPWITTSIAQDIETVQLGFSVGLLTAEESAVLVEYVGS